MATGKPLAFKPHAEKTRALQARFAFFRFQKNGPGPCPCSPVRRRTPPGIRRAAASLTVEAALVLPLFLFAMYLLILPLRMMNTARQIQEICESVCEEAVKLHYLKSITPERAEAGSSEDAGDGGSSAEALESLSESGSGRKDEGAEDSGFSPGLSASLTGNALGLWAAALARAKVDDNYVMHLISLRSSALSDGETFTLILDYDYRLPFSVFGLGSIHQSVAASRRAWIGRSGPGISSGEFTPGDGGETVYVGKDSTRYHLSPSCHYLSNSLEAVSFDSVGGRRNESGGKYAPCSRCAAGVSGGTVYIMPSGSAYHASEDCSAIRSYCRAVPKSEVEHLGPCSYCGGK